MEQFCSGRWLENAELSKRVKKFLYDGETATTTKQSAQCLGQVIINSFETTIVFVSHQFVFFFLFTRGERFDNMIRKSLAEREWFFIRNMYKARQQTVDVMIPRRNTIKKTRVFESTQGLGGIWPTAWWFQHVDEPMNYERKTKYMDTNRPRKK